MLAGVVQQDLDDHRHHVAQDAIGIAQLVAIHRATPSGTAMNQLVA